MNILVALAGVIGIGIVAKMALLVAAWWEREKERRRHVRYMSMFLQEPTEDPSQCEHQWREYTSGNCFSNYEGYSPEAPYPCETYTIYMCPKCHAKTLTCTGKSIYYRTPTGRDVCVGCACTPDRPDEVHAE